MRTWKTINIKFFGGRRFALRCSGVFAFLAARALPLVKAKEVLSGKAWEMILGDESTHGVWAWVSQVMVKALEGCTAIGGVASGHTVMSRHKCVGVAFCKSACKVFIFYDGDVVIWRRRKSR